MMTEDEARDFFEHLPLDERLRLVRDILGDIEGRIIRARAELNGETRQLVLPSLEPLNETVPPLPSRVNDRTAWREAKRRDPLAESPVDEAPANTSPGETDQARQTDEWPDLDIDELTGGSLHPVHRMRLMDVAAQYEKLLKRYGYIKGIPDPRTILRQELRESADPKHQRRRTDTFWAEWVARDSDTLDRPLPHEWSDWVALGDDDSEA